MYSSSRFSIERSVVPTGSFVALEGHRQAERFLDAALPGVHDAGRPYVDWFFGGPAEARAALRSWMARPSSEVFVGRAVLLVADDAVLGGLIALSGAELARCRQADTVAAISLAGPAGRSNVIERVKLSRELFAPVVDDAWYLSKIWVSPEAQGAGHGAALLQHYLDIGTRDGFTRFQLDVWSGNDAAIRLYRRFGFETIQESSSERAAMSYISMVAEPKSV
jgi:ribosomal protein S18 acetylase RimI-like enzyme